MPSSSAGRHGLCDRCRHQRIVANTRGSSFSLCQLSQADPAFPKYPSVPVLRCPGFEAPATAPGDSPRA